MRPFKIGDVVRVKTVNGHSWLNYINSHGQKGVIQDIIELVQWDKRYHISVLMYNGDRLDFLEEELEIVN